MLGFRHTKDNGIHIFLNDEDISRLQKEIIKGSWIILEDRYKVDLEVKVNGTLSEPINLKIYDREVKIEIRKDIYNLLNTEGRYRGHENLGKINMFSTSKMDLAESLAYLGLIRYM